MSNLSYVAYQQILVGTVGIEPKSYNLRYFGIVSFQVITLRQVPGNAVMLDASKWYENDLSRKVCK